MWEKHCKISPRGNLEPFCREFGLYGCIGAKWLLILVLQFLNFDFWNYDVYILFFNFDLWFFYLVESFLADLIICDIQKIRSRNRLGSWTLLILPMQKPHLILSKRGNKGLHYSDHQKPKREEVWNVTCGKV